MATLLRITRHALDAEREAFLKSVYGDDLKIVTDDLQYGSDPVGAVREAIKRHGDVVAVDAIVPFPILMKLVDARRDMGVAFIRATFKRDEGGRAIVVGQEPNGRDILAFGGYEELVRIVFEAQPLTPRQ